MMNTIKLFLSSLVLFVVATAQAVGPIGGSNNGLSAVSDDANPTLGGDLNGGGHSISNVASVTATAADTQTFTVLDDVDQTFGLNFHAQSDITGSNKGLYFITGNNNRHIDVSAGDVVFPVGTMVARDSTDTLTNKGLAGSTNTVADTVTVTHDNTAVPNQSGGWTEYYVTGSDFSTANTAATDVTGLISGTLTNNVRYEVDVDLLLLNDNDANGLKIALRANGGGTVAVNACGTVNTTSATGGNTICIGANNTLSTALQAYTNGQGTASFHGFITTSTTGTATISVAIAKATASGNAKCLIGSRLWIRRAHT